MTAGPEPELPLMPDTPIPLVRGPMARLLSKLSLFVVGAAKLSATSKTGLFSEATILATTTW